MSKSEKLPFRVVSDPSEIKSTRATCPEHGETTFAIWLDVAPEVNKKTGRVRKDGMKAAFCAECFMDGTLTRLGQ